MAEPDGSGISARLWRLPGQLLLALINATAILVIVAAIVALVAIARINRFAENVVATMTDAVLSKVDLPKKDVLANIGNLASGSSHAWQHHSGNQGRRTPGPSTRVDATQGGIDRPECQRRPARKREIDPHRRSDWAVGPDGHRRSDEAEGLLFQRSPNGARTAPSETRRSNRRPFTKSMKIECRVARYRNLHCTILPGE